MKAIYNLNSEEVKYQLSVIEKYTKLIEREKSFQDLANLDNINSYNNTINNANKLITDGILIENESRINLIINSKNKKNQLTIIN